VASGFTNLRMNQRSATSAQTPFTANSNSQRLWSARVISRFGSALGYVVLIWYVYAATGSALAVVYVGLAQFVPTIAFGIFSGAVVDHHERRRVVVFSSLGRSAAIGALVVSLYAGGFHLPIIVLASAIFAVCAPFFSPGSQALLPEIIPHDALDKANRLFESSESVVAIAGSAAAAALRGAVGAIPSLGIDAASYFVGALFVALIGATLAPSTPATGSRSLIGDVREGLIYLGKATRPRSFLHPRGARAVDAEGDRNGRSSRIRAGSLPSATVAVVLDLNPDPRRRPAIVHRRTMTDLIGLEGIDEVPGE